jgi:G3E family GTPase
VADAIVVTKTDMVPSDTVDQLMARLRLINPAAPISTAVFGEVDADRFWRPGHASTLAARFAVEWPRTASPLTPVATERHHRHAAEPIRSLALTFDQPLDWIAFSVWLSMLLHARGEDVLRVKGLLHVGSAGPVVLNCVQHIVHAPEHLVSWPDTARRSRLVFILQAIDPHDIVTSLQAFQHLLGAQPSVADSN